MHLVWKLFTAKENQAGDAFRYSAIMLNLLLLTALKYAGIHNHQNLHKG